MKVHALIIGLAVVLTIACPSIPEAVASEPAAKPSDTPVVTGAALIKRVPPRYPAKAIERGEEGWVDLEFTVTPEGTTSDIRIVAARPKRVFDRSAVNAISKWAYTPRTESGVPVPQANNRVVLSFALTDATTVRPALAPLYLQAENAVEAHRWDEAEKTVAALNESEALSLVELAKIQRLRGEIAFGRKDFAAAADDFARALETSPHGDLDARNELAERLVVSAFNGHDFARGLQAFDVWNPGDTTELRPLRRTVEAVRTALAARRPVSVPVLQPSE